jgi:hypothetical protein
MKLETYCLSFFSPRIRHQTVSGIIYDSLCYLPMSSHISPAIHFRSLSLFRNGFHLFFGNVPFLWKFKLVQERVPFIPWKFSFHFCLLYVYWFNEKIPALPLCLLSSCFTAALRRAQHFHPVRRTLVQSCTFVQEPQPISLLLLNTSLFNDISSTAYALWSKLPQPVMFLPCIHGRCQVRIWPGHRLFYGASWLSSVPIEKWRNVF